MIFQDVLRQLDVEKYKEWLIKSGYPTDEQNEYLVFIETLLTLKPDDTTSSLMLNEKNDRTHVVVFEEGQVYSLDFIPWEEIMGYTVDLEKIEYQMSIEAFCQKVLYLMSFDGFNRDLRETQIQQLKDRVNEIRRQ